MNPLYMAPDPVWSCGPARPAQPNSEDMLVRISKWLDDANKGRDSEAITWGRLAKITEEAGEVIEAFIGATGQNPRKGTTHTRHDVAEELLDVAVTAVGAYEHVTGHKGTALRELARKILDVAARAGLLDEETS